MDQAAADRARGSINRVGRVVSFRRLTSSNPQTIANRADVKATVRGYAPEKIVNGITVGSRRVIVSKLELAAAGYPVPPAKNDKIFLGDALDIPTTIDAVDADHREYQGCYEIVTKGN